MEWNIRFDKGLCRSRRGKRMLPRLPEGGSEMGVGFRMGNRFFLFPNVVFFLFLCFCGAFLPSGVQAWEDGRRGRTQDGETVAVSAAGEEKADSLFELVLLKDGAEGGDPEAQFELGRRYLQGVGLERNDVMALHWVKASAEQGYARAEAGLGWMYAVGRGVPRDDAKSFVWYEKAAKNGYAVAQRMLGKYYEKGVGTERNPELARQWYEKAAAQGDEKAVRYLRLSGVSAGEPDAASVR